MYRPNNTCTIYQAAGKTNLFGQPIPGASVDEPCAIVKIAPKEQKTPVSTRVSASRMGAMELTADAIILLGPKTVARYDDVISIDGGRYKIIGMRPQHSLSGLIDHFEAHASIYSQTQ